MRVHLIVRTNQLLLSSTHAEVKRSKFVLVPKCFNSVFHRYIMLSVERDKLLYYFVKLPLNYTYNKYLLHEYIFDMSSDGTLCT